MAGYRKLGRTSSGRKAMLRNLTTQLIHHGKITTTETRAKEVRRIAEKLITLAVKEQDNYETVTVAVKVPQKDANGKRVKEVVDGKRVTVFDEIQREIKKDSPTRLAARRKILSVLYPVTETTTGVLNKTPEGKKRNRGGSNPVNLANVMFEKWAPQYTNRNGGYTRIVKLGVRRGDAAEMVLLELV